MAERELQNILNSGGINTIFLGGTATADKVIKASDLDSINNSLTDLSAPLHGVINPGVPIISLNVDTSKYNVIAFDYYIHGIKYSYPGSTESSGFGQAGDFIAIGVFSGGITLKVNNFFTPLELETILEIGRIATADGTNITSIGDSVFFSDEYMQNLYVRFKSFEGAKFFNGTALVTKNTTTPLAMDIQGGSINTANMQTQTIPEETEVDGFPIYPIAGVSAIRAEQTPLLAQNTQYTDDTDLIAIPTEEFVQHVLFRSSGTTKYYLEYGNASYVLLSDAINATPPNTLFDIQGAEIEPLAKVIVQEGNPEIVQIVDIREGNQELTGDVATQAEIIEFHGESLSATQFPLVQDTAIQIEFGAAQAGENATLAADGSVTILTTGEYHVNTVMHMGRVTGGGGEAELYLRRLINGVQAGATYHSTVKDEKVDFPSLDFNKIYLLAGDIVTWELIRDSTGNNTGGLVQYTPNTSGWDSAPTASITVIKHQ